MIAPVFRNCLHRARVINRIVIQPKSLYWTPGPMAVKYFTILRAFTCEKGQHFEAFSLFLCRGEHSLATTGLCCRPPQVKHFNLFHCIAGELDDTILKRYALRSNSMPPLRARNAVRFNEEASEDSLKSLFVCLIIAVTFPLCAQPSPEKEAGSATTQRRAPDDGEGNWEKDCRNPGTKKCTLSTNQSQQSRPQEAEKQ